MPIFSSRVPGVLKVGDRVLVAGKIKEDARKFSVNLCADSTDEPRDVVLHFDVRFHRDNIISLSRKNGTWVGSGSYDTNCNLFVRGTFFRILFEIKDASVITIYCQNKFHSNFLPKIPLSAARFVVVWSDVERITQIDYYLGQHGARDASPLPRSPMPPPPPAVPPTGVPHIDPTRVYVEGARNRGGGMCANEYPRLQRTSSSSADDVSQEQETEDTRTEIGDNNSAMTHEESYVTLSSPSRTVLKSKNSFYNKARAPFQQVCHFVTKSRRNRKPF